MSSEDRNGSGSGSGHHASRYNDSSVPGGRHISGPRGRGSGYYRGRGRGYYRGNRGGPYLGGAAEETDNTSTYHGGRYGDSAAYYHPYRGGYRGGARRGGYHNSMAANTNAPYHGPSRLDTPPPPPPPPAAQAQQQASAMANGGETRRGHKKRIDEHESPFLYLTELDQGDEASVAEAKKVLAASSTLDGALRASYLRRLASETEVSLLSNQCERDTLNVQLTQEKLDSLLLG
ncbi:hypothetical protein NCAS_0C02280 [Naumovozyma castellii]|uniref:Transcription regulator LGE1 helical region domain-containing protein n=1 Tax=Naumovozyma castellii TaxID=27288 RepID=G0VCK8_NAUCA|nr:hypothetical protein NCAS_0C02280 [Naumovozyma castellii CBS 4309]CCC69218.1 hypothetical protein NCAS_0C02280 [Naumovozyma castellii CBS 4309]